MSQKNSPKKSSGSHSVPRTKDAVGRNQRTLRKDQDDMPAIFQDRDIPVAATAKAATPYNPLPLWYKVIMFGLMILGLIWIITYYIMQTTGPVPGWGGWNITAGFGLILVGFLMMLRWR
jgi:hypothetical protein